MITIVTPAAAAIHSVSVFSCLVSGVCSRVVVASIPAIFPTCVSAPVAVTTIRPLPCVTGVCMNAMSVCSPGARSSPSGTSTPFEAGTLSPVSADSSICSELAVDDPPIRRDVVAGREHDDVADDHLFGRDLGLGPVAADPRGRLDHRLERVHRALRLALLAQADDGVEHRDQDQQDARAPLLDRERHDRRGQQDDLHVAAVLLEEAPPTRHRRLRRQRVRAVLLRAARRPCRPESPTDGSTPSRDAPRPRRRAYQPSSAAARSVCRCVAVPIGASLTRSSAGRAARDLRVAACPFRPSLAAASQPAARARTGRRCAPSGAWASSVRLTSSRRSRWALSTVGNRGSMSISAFTRTAAGADPGEPLPVGGNHVPRRPLRARVREHLRERLLVVVPALALLDVRGGELPVVVGQVQSPQEPDALLLLGEVEEQLHDPEAVLGQVPLPIVDLAVAPLPHVLPWPRAGQLLAIEVLRDGPALRAPPRSGSG